MTSPPGPGGLPGPPVTLASLIWDWGTAYVIGYDRDQWTAARRDGHAIVYAHTLALLASAIEANYRARPVSRDCDPPGATSYLDTGQDNTDGEDGAALGEDESFVLAALADAFPAWTISYSYTTGTWTARTRKTSIRHGSPVLLCAAIVQAERRHRGLAAGPP